jgi:bifunctional DNase/RNase
VEITELKEQTFYARVLLKSNGEIYEVDARPSDSIALALKSGAPLYAEEALFNLQAPGQSSDSKGNSESLADRLKKINPEDFGKYSL